MPRLEYINATAVRFLRCVRQPVISVDTKKKESWLASSRTLGGNGNQRASRKKVLVHDFPTDACGKAIPYGVYDMTSKRRRG